MLLPSQKCLPVWSHLGPTSVVRRNSIYCHRYVKFVTAILNVTYETSWISRFLVVVAALSAEELSDRGMVVVEVG
jgi:hypothetical protein